jgi:anti-sigma factor RsiW
MTEPTCAEVRDAAAEFALDILEPAERAAVAAHLLRCPACREEVDSMVSVGARLIELVPGTEPPLGFDHRVLARVRQTRPDRGRGRAQTVIRRRPRVFAAVAAAAAAVALVFGSLGWFAGRNDDHRATKVILTAGFTQGGRHVGNVEVYTSGDGSPWLTMTVQGAEGIAKVTCELIGTNGSHTEIGSFPLVDGSGTWGAPDPAGVAGVAGVQLVSTDSHQLIATATFHA